MATVIRAIRPNYTRFGKVISQENTVVEKLTEFFPGSNRTEEVLLKELIKDKNILVSENVKLEAKTIMAPAGKEKAEKTKEPAGKKEE